MTNDDNFPTQLKELSKPARSYLFDLIEAMRKQEANEPPVYELSAEDEQAHARSMAQLRSGNVLSIEESEQLTAEHLAQRNSA